MKLHQNQILSQANLFQYNPSTHEQNPFFLHSHCKIQLGDVVKTPVFTCPEADDKIHRKLKKKEKEKSAIRLGRAWSFPDHGRLALITILFSVPIDSEYKTTYFVV